MTTTLESIEERVARGHELERDDVRLLWESKDLLRLGIMADEARRSRHDGTVTFVRVLPVTAEQLPDVTIPLSAGEVRIDLPVGGLDTRFDHIRAVVERAAGTPVTCGSLHELEAVGSRDELTRLLRGLQACGVWGVASAAVDRLVDPATTVAAVLDAGLDVARFVVGRPARNGPWDVLDRVKAIQRATGAVRAFAPLSRDADPAAPTTGFGDVKAVSIARLALDIASIQVDWTLHGPKLAQVALLFGADDVDAVSPAEDLGTGRRRAPLEEILRNIRAASLSPQERDGRFAPRGATGTPGRAVVANVPDAENNR